MSQPLSAPRLHARLTTQWMGKRVSVYDELSSTNTQALEQARTGAPHGSVVLAETQRAGRGRQGRTWFSPPLANIYCSIVLKRPPHSTGLPWIPLVTGTAISRALEGHVTCPVTVKWPNDLLVGSKKVGGILCEAVHQSEHNWIAVVGFGLNVNLDRHMLPPDLREIATSLSMETGRYVDRHDILASILAALECDYDRLLAHDLAGLRHAYIQRCTTLGQCVVVQLANGRHLRGLAVDIGLDGALQIQVARARCPDRTGQPAPSCLAIHAGEIIHVRAQSVRRSQPQMPTTFEPSESISPPCFSPSISETPTS